MADAESSPLLVACLCAAWCGTCRDYRAVFDSLTALPESAGEQWSWVDIEDDEALMGPVDVDDFPSLLIARGGIPVFFGPVLPHLGTARALVERARRGELAVVKEPDVLALAQRLRNMPRPTAENA